jgi:bacteriocin biosynthesis cyclodehydratase domain-containing protein
VLLLLLLLRRAEGRLTLEMGADRPALKPWYRLACCDAGMTARFGPSTLLFEGAAARELLPVLLPLLDGSRTVEELARRLGPHSRSAIERVLATLEAHGLLRHGLPASTPTKELLQATISRPRAITGSRVSVLGEGSLAREIARVLRRSGFGKVGADWDADLVVAAPLDALERLRNWNDVALERGTPWLAVTPWDGSIAAVGPLMVPGETACHTCYTTRRHADPYASHERPLRSRHLSSPALDAVLAGLAVTVATTWVAGGDTPALGAILAVEYERQVVTRHHVYRVPRCPSCAPTTTVLTPWGGERAVAA